MKKILLTLVCSLGAFAFAQKYLNSKDINSPLPAIKLVSDNGKTYTNKDIKQGHNFFLMLFNPTCSHCELVARHLSKDGKEFKDNSFYMLSASDMMPYMKSFRERGEIVGNTQFPVGIDSANAIKELFNYRGLPQINVYNDKHILIKSFNGETALDSARTYIR